MQNLEDDLREECLVSPVNMKKLIYRQPMKFEYPCTKPKPSKGRIYSMNEKFEYALEKIDPDKYAEFLDLPEKSKSRIERLFSAYHDWKWPMPSDILHRMGKEQKSDLTRFMRLLECAGLATNNKAMLGKTPYLWSKFAFTSEEVIEILIEKRNKMTEWEKEYYTVEKRREKKKLEAKKSKTLVETLGNIEFKEIDPRILTVPTSVPEEKEEKMKEYLQATIDTIKPTSEDILPEEDEEEDNFILIFNERYNMFMEIFPDTDARQLQKIFLTLILEEYEK